MPQTQYAFVIKAPAYEMATHHAILESPAFRTRIIGVSSQTGALAAVDRLVGTALRSSSCAAASHRRRQLKFASAPGRPFRSDW